eukprot:CAMPEP_0181311710 /NCGR_PEP_ID=MMETSP1101-20121128/13294_1 /TAXON_ID=46948 /ORGANISM="Rhodomonas abbreviata, Strain Caron Lab Isolate" /LENGTH=320 /DNA_ID=CAMNT_0023418483 /DNA_START=630 /DNA_END=1592 /DNA_ORIENTATION=+
MVAGFVISSAVLIFIVLKFLDNDKESGSGESTNAEAASYEQFDIDKDKREVLKGRNTPAWFGTNVQFYFRSIWSIVWADKIHSLTFFVTVFVLGIGTTLVEGLVFLFWTDDLGASNFLCGVSVLVTVSFEIPLFYYSEHLLNRFDEHVLLVLSGVCYVVRVVCYTLFENAWWVLAVEPLHGVTFAFMQLASVHYTAKLAPPGLETSAQGLTGTVRSLGSITGTLAGGVIMQRLGSVFLYRGSATLVLVTISLHWLVGQCQSSSPLSSRAEVCPEELEKGGGGDLPAQPEGAVQGTLNLKAGPGPGFSASEDSEPNGEVNR